LRFWLRTRLPPRQTFARPDQGAKQRGQPRNRPRAHADPPALSGSNVIRNFVRVALAKRSNVRVEGFDLPPSSRAMTTPRNKRASSVPVIASEAKQPRGHITRPLGCFVARTPRNDGRAPLREIRRSIAPFAYTIFAIIASTIKFLGLPKKRRSRELVSTDCGDHARARPLPPSRAHIHTSAPSSAASPKKSAASEMRATPTRTLAPVRLVAM
jgi:hypothetical protein